MRNEQNVDSFYSESEYVSPIYSKTDSEYESLKFPPTATSQQTTSPTTAPLTTNTLAKEESQYEVSCEPYLHFLPITTLTTALPTTTSPTTTSQETTPPTTPPLTTNTLGKEGSQYFEVSYEPYDA